jgi:hypothetical protein
LGIKHTTTSPYHPQCNAQAEVFNKTMAHYLATALADAEIGTLDWEIYLAPLIFSYNTGVHKSTKMTPYYATFGLHPKIPLWEGFEEPNLEIPKNLSFADHLAQIRHAQQTARQITVQNNDFARQAYVDQHAKHTVTKFPTYQKGDLVWVRICQNTNPNPKLGCKYEKGIVVERLQQNAYKVNRVNRPHKKIKTLNVQLLKPRFSEHFPMEDDDEDQQTPLRPQRVPPRPHQDQRDAEDDINDEPEEPQHEEYASDDEEEDFHGFQEQQQQHQEEAEQPEEDSEDDGDDDDDFTVPDYEYHDAVAAMDSMAEAINDLRDKQGFDSLVKNGVIDFDRLMELLSQGWSLNTVTNPGPAVPRQRQQQQQQQRAGPARQQPVGRTLKRRGKTGRRAGSPTPSTSSRPPEMSCSKKFKKSQSRKSKTKSTGESKPSVMQRLINFLPDGKRKTSAPARRPDADERHPLTRSQVAQAKEDKAGQKFSAHMSQLRFGKENTKPNTLPPSSGHGERRRPHNLSFD